MEVVNLCVFEFHPKTISKQIFVNMAPEGGSVFVVCLLERLYEVVCFAHGLNRSRRTAGQIWQSGTQHLYLL